jgi:hypothetical protein
MLGTTSSWKRQERSTLGASRGSRTWTTPWFWTSGWDNKLLWFQTTGLVYSLWQSWEMNVTSHFILLEIPCLRGSLEALALLSGSPTLPRVCAFSILPATLGCSLPSYPRPHLWCPGASWLPDVHLAPVCLLAVTSIASYLSNSLRGTRSWELSSIREEKPCGGGECAGGGCRVGWGGESK